MLTKCIGISSNSGQRGTGYSIIKWLPGGGPLGAGLLSGMFLGHLSIVLIFLASFVMLRVGRGVVGSVKREITPQN